MVKIVSWMISVLPQARQAEEVTQSNFILGGVLWTPILDFRDENPRSDLHWMYLAMADFYSSP
jgi:hypothetical protein